MKGRSVSSGLRLNCVSRQCTWPRWWVWWLKKCATSSAVGLVTSRPMAPENQVRSPASQCGSSRSAQPMMTSSKADPLLLEVGPVAEWRSTLSAIDFAFGAGVPANRCIQI